MSEQQLESPNAPLRIGAVRYLNSRPLTVFLAEVARRKGLPVEVVFDLPSRLATGLADGRLDVALIPSIEQARQPGTTIVSDACIASRGPVRSVNLFGRVPVERIRTLALDEGSRTSAALTRILLAERYHLRPELRPLPIGASPEETDADAILLIGDRGMLPPSEPYAFVWDLGDAWFQWTGLPFVFATWVARPGVDSHEIESLLVATREEGLGRLEEIARTEAPKLGLSEEACLSYLRHNLVFFLGPAQKQGLAEFFRLAGRHGLAPRGVELAFANREIA